MKTELIYSYFPLWLQNIACDYYSHKMTKLRFSFFLFWNGYESLSFGRRKK